MFDCHYDLLTYIFINKDNLKRVRKHCNKIFKNNITGGIFNLFYMSLKEMKEELGLPKEEIDIIENLKKVDILIKENKLIPQNIKYIYGIEGLDYLKKIEDVDIMYDLGVRSVNIVWNNDNKFGGGAKGRKSLTSLGEKLVEKLVNKNIAIDLSHVNEKTFYNIIEICNALKNKGQKPIVFASHSNVKRICNVVRNLSDDQIIKIKELDGVIGIVGVKSFCIQEDKFNNDKRKYYDAYIKHIKYLKDLLGGVDNIAVSTDDMTYYETKYYKQFNVFKQEKIKKELEKILFVNGFKKDESNYILYLNSYNKILKLLKK